MAIRQIIYRSIATVEVSPLILTDLLETARHHNRRMGLTGVLVCLNGRFAQVLEGPEDAVITVMQRIARDYRHHSLEMLSDRMVVAREFGAWSMAFSGSDWRSTDDCGFDYPDPQLPHILLIEELVGQGATVAQLLSAIGAGQRRLH